MTPTPTDPREERPEINTHVRLFDLVRYQRSELLHAKLITEEEYTWLCAGPMAMSPKGGSPSRQRLEDYDEIRATNSNLAAEIAELKAARDEANESVTLNYNTILELRQIITETKAELEAARKERDEYSGKWAALTGKHARLNELYQLAVGNQEAWMKRHDTALAAKERAEKRVTELVDILTGEIKTGSKVHWMSLLDCLEKLQSVKLSVWAQVHAKRIRAALTPAPTQEPPAGGVTISNDSRIADQGPLSESQPVSPSEKADLDAEPNTDKTADSSRCAEWQPPAITPSNSPADVPSEGRGEWMPIETAPKDGTYILLLGDSGYLTTPWRVNVGAWKPGFRDAWVDHANDRITDGGTEPTHWLPLDAFMLPPEGSGA